MNSSPFVTVTDDTFGSHHITVPGIGAFVVYTGMTRSDFLREMRAWLDRFSVPSPVGEPPVQSGPLRARLGTTGKALMLDIGDESTALWPEDGPRVWAETLRKFAVKLSPVPEPEAPVVGSPVPDESPSREQQKAAWAFVGATLRLAAANTREGFDARMIEAARVMCEANERAS